jgi:hypothetical protein
MELTGQVCRTEVRRHYEWANVFVFPTICDSFGIVQVEALAAALPVITTDGREHEFTLVALYPLGKGEQRQRRLAY